MRGSFEGQVLVFCGLFGLGLAQSACSGGARDCNETLTCRAPIGYIDAGNFDNWWSAGAAGESAAGDTPQQIDPEAGPSDGGNGGESGATATGSATDEPRVLNVSPSNGALGVESDTAIVITFSEPMATSAIEAAYQSPDLPAALLAFTWNDAGTALTIRPTAPLLYQAGTAQSNGRVDFLPKTYHYGFTQLTSHAAASSVGGSFSFSTLREVSADLLADPSRTGNWTAGEGEGIHNCLRDAKPPYAPTVCVGDDSNNVRYVGFVSFDLSELPETIARFSSASLTADGLTYGSPNDLGPSVFEHVEFGALDASAVSTPALADLGAFYGNAALTSGSHLALLKDVTSAVGQDYADRQSDGRVTQYRLSFASIEPNGIWDDVEFPTSSIHLSLSYLLP